MGQFRFVKGNTFKDLAKVQDKLQEGFVKGEQQIHALVSAEKISKVFDRYLDVYPDEDFFFFIEVPAQIDEEDVIKESKHGQMGILRNTHRKVYYLDHIHTEVAREIFHAMEDVLINDGLSAFGFGTRHGELGKYKYNLMILHGYEHIDSLAHVFTDFGIEERNVTFAEELFTSDNPGMSTQYEDQDGRTVYDIIEVLTELGLYEAETRADLDE